MPENDSANRKMLVIAGTHQREAEFSHPVADLIVSYYGGSVSKPELEMIGIDKARKADLWDFGKMTVAKIHKIGEPSIDYIRSLPHDRLFYLANFRALNSSNGAEIAEAFGDKERQWTSVTQPLLDVTKPSFFFDLHSHHKYTKGLMGTGAYIFSCAREESSDLVSRSLAEAQSEEQDVYGRPDAGRCSIEKRFNPHILEYFTRAEMIKLLSIPQEEVPYNSDISSFLQRVGGLGKQNENKIAEKWGNQWYFRRGGYDDDEIDNFCLEAVHWGKENQEATARFLTKYLAEML